MFQWVPHISHDPAILCDIYRVLCCNSEFNVFLVNDVNHFKWKGKNVLIFLFEQYINFFSNTWTNIYLLFDSKSLSVILWQKRMQKIWEIKWHFLDITRKLANSYFGYLFLLLDWFLIRIVKVLLRNQLPWMIYFKALLSI